MKSGFSIIFALVFATALSTSAFGQEKFSILFDGSALVGKTKVSGLNEMKAKSAVFPGVEVRFNQDGRITLGVSYQHWQLTQDPVHVSFPVYRQENQVFVSWDESSDATGDIVFATVYINLVTQGKIRPFVGGGPGIGRFRVSSYILNIVDTDLPFFQSGAGDQTFTESKIKLLYKGIAGLNIYPAKHLVLSLGGGYINGPAVKLGAGFTF